VLDSPLVDWLVQQGEWLWRDYTVAGLVLLLFGCVAWWRHGRERPQRSVTRQGELWLLGLPGLLFVLVFRSGSYEHEYWWLHLTPVIGMLIAFGLVGTARLIGRWTRPGGVVLAALLWALIAFELALPARWQYYRSNQGQSTIAAFAYIARTSPPDTVVYTNQSFWVEREYYEGPMMFLNPHVAWMLDRKCLQAATRAHVDRVAPRAPYYLFVLRKRDLALGRDLYANYSVRQRWGNVAVFDLTRPAQGAR
jgi:hypothetical protein